jgi:hypothetical protein
MRVFRPTIWSALLLNASLLAAAPIHPIAERIRNEFPSIPIAGSARFETTNDLIGGRIVPGLRTTDREAALRVTYPLFYSDPFVVSHGDQRIVLRALKTRGASAEAADGNVYYAAPYESVDAVALPERARSEELLLLLDNRAPLVYDYEIVDMSGVAGIVMDGGAVRFTLPQQAAAVAGARFVETPREIQIDPPLVIDSQGRRSGTVAHWSIEGKDQKILRLTLDAAALSYPVLLDPTFSITGNLVTARGQHSSTLLPNGKVLLAGGNYAGGTLAYMELYDTATGLFSTTSNILTTPRELHTATLLLNGKVLLAGGVNAGGAVATAELYDPVTGFVTATGSLSTARYAHTATLLQNGQVLIAGGQGTGGALSTAELYDPATGLFSSTGTLTTARQLHTATLLQNGKVLIVGGFPGPVASAELYNPSTGLFGATGAPVTARYSHTATLLSTGKVLIAGGFGTTTLASAELYDPAGAGTFSATGSLIAARMEHTATLLPNGKVLIAGGAQGATALASAELYDPTGLTFGVTASLSTARYFAAATLLSNGSVLITGGQGVGGYLASAERFDPLPAGSSTSTGSLGGPRKGATATLLPDARVLIAGGDDGAGGVYAGALTFDSSGSGVTATNNLNTARESHTATLLPNGKVLIAGGFNASPLASAELFDPGNSTFSNTGALGTARFGHTATLLANGKVLIAAGSSDAFSISPLSSAEIYDPANGMFSPTGNLNVSRYAPSATLLANGKVLIAGGEDAAGLPKTSAELYDPLSGTFTNTGSMTVARSRQLASLLSSGKVLVQSGNNNDFATYLTAELYDPATGTFSTTGSRLTGQGGAATVLADGKILMSGGNEPHIENNAIASCQMYDSLSGTFSLVSPMTDSREIHAAILLTNGKVLIAGGLEDVVNQTVVASAELHDEGISYPDARRPLISSAPTTLVEPATITVTGSGFRGDFEGSGGSFNSSSTNMPVLQVQRLDNDQFATVGATSWSDTSFASAAVSGLPTGHYRLRVIANGIPSADRILLITGGPTISSINPNGGSISGGQSVTITGTNLLGTNVTIGGITIAGPVTTATTLTFTTPAHAAGAVDVTVTGINGSVTASSGYTYFPLTTPTGFSATATSNSAVALRWSAVTDATSYDVWRSSLNQPYTLVLTTSATSATDSGLNSDTTYPYKVRAKNATSLSGFSALDPATTTVFIDSSLSGVVVQAVHLAQIRTAVNAMRAAVGLSPVTFTDSSLTGGSTIIRGVHVTELRDALGAARALMSLPVIFYTDPGVLTGTSIRAVHLMELRAATQ